MGPGADHDRETGERLPDIPSLMEVERRILACDTRLGELVEEYAELVDTAARARCAWEEHRDRMIVFVADQGERTSEDVRLARAKQAISTSGMSGHELHQVYLITQGTADSCAKGLNAMQARLSALQTLARGLRSVTGLDP